MPTNYAFEQSVDQRGPRLTRQYGRRTAVQTHALAVMKAIAMAFGAFILSAAANATASSCTPRDPAEVARHAPYAFVGRVVTVEPSQYERAAGACTTTQQNGGCGSRLNTIEVVRVLRGSIPERVKVISEDVCSCFGAFLGLNREYLIVADGNSSQHPGDFIARSKCEGTTPLLYEHQKKALKAWEGE
jgi:hypothetical protein